MTEDEDWDFDEETTSESPKPILVIVLVAVLIIASVGTFLILRDDDDFPSEAKAPKLRAGMDWWFKSEETIIDHETGSSEIFAKDYVMIGVKEITSHGGKEAYAINTFDAIRATTRHYSNQTAYLSTENLNGLDDEGNEYVLFDFPLKDGKTWNWIDEHDNNRTYVCRAVRDVKTQDGTYDTYWVRINWTEEDGDNRDVYTQDVYYSPELGYLVKSVSMYSHYENDDPTTTEIWYGILVAHGTSDSDGDELSDTGEKWFGTDPGKKDTDSDGYDDLVDFVPLFDVGLSLNLTHVSTDDDVESIQEVNLFGEEEGADFFFDLSNNDNSDVLVTDPIENSDSSDLDIVYRINISDDIYTTTIDVNCFDADDGTADDEMDVTMNDNFVTLQLRFNIYNRNLRISGVGSPEGELELDVEQEAYGDGNGDYDATLHFIVSEVDMANYT